MKLIIKLVLWVLIIFLGWKLYSSIIGPVEFNKKRDARYAKVIKNLKDIQAAELAYKEITGKFTGSFDSLVRFIDTAQFAIIQRRDTSYADEKKNKAYGLDAKTGGYILEAVLIDTLKYVSVKKRTFQNTDRYKTMMIIPLEEEGITDTIELRVGEVIKNQGRKNEKAYSAFEARVSKGIILEGLDKDLINQEQQVVSVEGVNGAFVKVGSLEEVDTSGNWPKIYDAVPDNTKNEKSKSSSKSSSTSTSSNKDASLEESKRVYNLGYDDGQMAYGLPASQSASASEVYMAKGYNFSKLDYIIYVQGYKDGQFGRKRNAYDDEQTKQ